VKNTALTSAILTVVVAFALLASCDNVFVIDILPIRSAPDDLYTVVIDMAA
jgi:hypothetical protein